METTRILWSGLTGKTGLAAIKAARGRDDVKIVSGICRTKMTEIIAINDVSLDRIKWFQYKGLDFSFRTFNQFLDIDVIVDFSHPQHLAEMTTLAVMLGKPLIIGTSGLNDLQLVDLKRYTSTIPIFRDGIFLFALHNFIDEAIEFARNCGGDFTLFENFYEGKSLPSEASKIIQQRIYEEAGVMVDVHSAATFDKNPPLVCNWELLRKDKYSQDAYLSEGPRCHVIDCYDELAQDVLEIAKVMAKQPVKKGELYDLDELWDDLVLWAL